jgi:hypothetical protein
MLRVTCHDKAHLNVKRGTLGGAPHTATIRSFLKNGAGERAHATPLSGTACVSRRLELRVGISVRTVRARATHDVR